MELSQFIQLMESAFVSTMLVGQMHSSSTYVVDAESITNNTENFRTWLQTYPRICDVNAQTVNEVIIIKILQQNEI